MATGTTGNSGNSGNTGHTGSNRRSEPRVAIELPCKVWHPRAMRFLAGTTRDLSRDGAMVSLRSGVPFRPGERIRLGLPHRGGAIVLRGGDLIEGTVVRTSTEDGRVTVAVAFEGPAQAQADAVARSEQGEATDRDSPGGC